MSQINTFIAYSSSEIMTIYSPALYQYCTGPLNKPPQTNSSEHNFLLRSVVLFPWKNTFLSLLADICLHMQHFVRDTQGQCQVIYKTMKYWKLGPFLGIPWEKGSIVSLKWTHKFNTSERRLDQAQCSTSCPVDAGLVKYHTLTQVIDDEVKTSFGYDVDERGQHL